MKIGIASDHRGYVLKEKIINYLKSKSINVEDFGTNSTDSVDYPKYAFKLSTAIVEKKIDFGIVICGTGIGISIACNKVRGIRCAKVSSVEETIHTREDNDANVVAFGENIDEELAFRIVDAFINTPFSNLEKHKKRIEMIKEYEDSHYAC